MTLATTASASGAPQHSALAHVWQLLESLTDPEIPVVTLRELGILRDVRTSLLLDGTEQLEVIITPTYSGCPAIPAGCGSLSRVTHPSAPPLPLEPRHPRASP